MIVPVIDIGAFVDAANSTPEARDQVVKAVGDACRHIGFLVITNHGVPAETIETTFAAAKEYFDEPHEQKMKVAMGPDYPYGYENGEVLSKSLDDGAKAKADLKETFQICLGALGKTPELAPRWPESPASFQPAMTAYYRALEKLGGVMLSIFAHALELPGDWFEAKIDNHMSSLRIL